MSNYTKDDLVQLRHFYSSKEIIDYFDLDEEDKECLKKIDELIQCILDANFNYGYGIPKEKLIDKIFEAIDETRFSIPSNVIVSKSYPKKRTR